MMKFFYSFLQSSPYFSKKSELLQTTQMYFRILGINLIQTTQKNALNLRSLRTYLVFGSATVSSLCYTLYLAKTFEDYITTLYALSTMLLCLTCYSFVIWRMESFTSFFSERRQMSHEGTLRRSQIILLKYYINDDLKFH